MADYSEYSIPTEEWTALEKTLPPPATNLDVHALKDMFNRAREERAANAMVNEPRLCCNNTKTSTDTIRTTIASHDARLFCPSKEWLSVRSTQLPSCRFAVLSAPPGLPPFTRRGFCVWYSGLGRRDLFPDRRYVGQGKYSGCGGECQLPPHPRVQVPRPVERRRRRLSLGP
jgi:hypothetical protein